MNNDVKDHDAGQRKLFYKVCDRAQRSRATYYMHQH